MATQTGAYKRLLGLLQAQRQDAVSEAGFALGKQAVEEEQDLREIQSELQKEIRRVEKGQRKRGRKKGLGGLLGSALGFALAGPLGLSASLATGLGSFAGSRLAGQKKIRGIDPNLTLRENAEFYKQQGDDLSAIVDDISSQLEESYKDELVSDVFTAIGSGATGGQLEKTKFGQNVRGFFDDKLFPNTRLNLGEKISNLGERAGQRFGNLFGGRGFVTDEQTAGGIFAGEVEKAARDMSIGLDSSLLFDRPGMLADEALADRFALSGSPYAPGVRGIMADTPASTWKSQATARKMAGEQLMKTRPVVPMLQDPSISGFLDNVIADDISIPLEQPLSPSSSMSAPMADLRNYFLQSFPAGASDFPFVGSPEDDMASDLLVEKIPNEFNMRQPALSRLLQLYGYAK
jgi:hypothetical protein